MTESTQTLEFREALLSRRERVYEYLDAWPGIESFRPAHMRDAILSYVARRGKGIRPALLMLSCGAVAGDEEQSIPAAAAVEIFHIWTLVHDDFIDRDETRRGSPTVHHEFARVAQQQLGASEDIARHYGASVAILAGDLQQSWSYALLCDLVQRGLPASLVIDLVTRMASSLTPQLMEGEMLDVQFSLGSQLSGHEQRSGVPTGAEILDMLAKKTGALLEYAAWAGARIGMSNGHGELRDADNLGSFARLCGLAFQLHDDVLGLTADESRLGKPVGSDLREGKHTYIVSLALERATEEQQILLLRALGNAAATPQELQSAIDVLRDTEAIQEAAALAERLVAQATAHLDTLPRTDQRELLRSWASYLLSRDY